MFLQQTELDAYKSPHEKTINLIVLIHKNLIDSYSSHNQPKLETKFLMWLFVRLLHPLLDFVDKFIQEGVFFDEKSEMGFKRSATVSIDHADYWKLGYELFFRTNQSFFEHLPVFMQSLLTNSFNICKYMEIVKVIDSFTEKSDICEKFHSSLIRLCPYLANNQSKALVLQETKVDTPKPALSLVEINFNNIRSYSSKYSIKSRVLPIVSIEDLFERHSDAVFDSEDDIRVLIGLNIEKTIEDTLSDCLSKYVKFCSNVLIEKLFTKYHMAKFFDFLHSHYLFKSSEIMFVFSKNLFDSIKSYETYHEDAILNKLFYEATGSVFTTTAQMQSNPFSANLVKFHYEQAQSTLVAHDQNNIVESSRLIRSLSISIKIEWPLNMIIKRADIESYNRIFLFILQMKQVKYDLNSLDLKGAYFSFY